MKSKIHRRLYWQLVWLTLPFWLCSPQIRANDEEPAVSRELPPLILTQGEQRLLNFPGLKRYSAGGKSIRAVALPHAQDPKAEAILLKGTQPGPADLWVWKQDGSSEHRSIRVEKWVERHMNLPLEQALSQLQETEVILSGSGVILRGPVHTFAESARVAGLARGFEQIVHDETEPTPELLEAAKRKLETWILQSGNSKRLHIDQEGSALRVSGSLPHRSSLSAIEKKIRGIFPLTEIALSVLSDDNPTIHFKVFLLEMRKSKFGELGVSWPSSQMGAFQLTAWGVSQALQLDLTLRAMEGEGNARILSNPELVVRAPGEAELFAGGEIPIRTETHFSSAVTWKPHGLTLKLKVTQATSERVRLDILTEVSQLGTTLSDEKIPSVQSNRMKTQVDASFGVPLLLSGLLQQNTREQAKGLPWLRKIPVLGSLFGSEDYLNDRSELVAILLPEATPPLEPMKRVARFSPKGKLPPPRNALSPSEERALKASADYPWNAFK